MIKGILLDTIKVKGEKQFFKSFKNLFCISVSNFQINQIYHKALRNKYMLNVKLSFTSLLLLSGQIKENKFLIP